MEIILVGVVGILILTAFYMGFVFGSKEKIETPKEKIEDAIKVVKDRKEEKSISEEEKQKMESYKKELKNIDGYMGDERGQEDL